MYYSLFVFRFYYKIIGLLFFIIGPRACGLTLARGYGPGVGLKRAGRAWAKH